MTRMRDGSTGVMGGSKHWMKGALRSFRSTPGETNTHSLMHRTKVFMRNRVRDQH